MDTATATVTLTRDELAALVASGRHSKRQFVRDTAEKLAAQFTQPLHCPVTFATTEHGGCGDFSDTPESLREGALINHLVTVHEFPVEAAMAKAAVTVTTSWA